MAVTAWGLLAVVGAWTLLVPPDLAGDDLGIRRFQTPEIGAGVQIGQSFRMNAAGLHAIDVRASAIGPVVGRIRLELRDNEGNGPIIRAEEIDASQLVLGESYRFEFAPIDESADRLFRLDFSSSSEVPSRGVVLLATKGRRFRDGTLVFMDRERWADLSFQTYTRGTSTWRALLASEHLPRVSGPIALAGLFLSWLAIGVILREAAKLGRDTCI